MTDPLPIGERFRYHPPKDDQATRYRILREEAFLLARKYEQFCPPSRERDIAIERLEEAAMWANAAIARNE